MCNTVQNDLLDVPRGLRPREVGEWLVQELLRGSSKGCLLASAPALPCPFTWKFSEAAEEGEGFRPHSFPGLCFTLGTSAKYAGPAPLLPEKHLLQEE